MVGDRAVKDARAAHRRALNVPRWAAWSKDPDTVLLRQHRQAHRWNSTHEELIEKRAVPKGDFRAQARLSDYDEAAARRRHADKLIADCERLQADHDARVERWRKMGWC